MHRRITGLLALAALMGSAPALAQSTPDCKQMATDSGKQLLVVAGSTALGPMLNVVGPKMAKEANILVAYLGNGSCNGVNGIVDPTNTMIAAGTALTVLPETYTDGAAGTPPRCTLTDAQAPDLGISDVFVETCTNAARPSNVADYLGPAQSMAFVAPTASTQTAITADEAYFAFGFGGADGKQASPWTDPKFMFIRPNSSGTLRILSGAINVPAEKWFGVRKNSTSGKDFGSGDVFNAVSTSTDAEKTIGILGMEYVDAGTNRSKIKVLALRGRGQKYAYYPDSTSSSFDKINVREGRYAGLGYAHMIAAVDGSGTPTNPAAKKFVDIVLGNEELPGVDLVETVAKDAHLVPTCAMKVKRTAEGGEMSLFKPTRACGCYFESKVGSAASSCTACSSDAQCGSDQSCNFGFCESK